ncbi:hypothetical protein G8764_05210 [Pseudomaricurvus alcaniphilus]|uniref:hypothetical protein n=1 Tax=Pseudomaricurvus alcaniphilus TaxID=1166482 RepID=UPI001407C3B4|nr:hypothetical protein [Pseudomaricurvus alcaniphilus]NHN36687.1 hypothetical protein [Pseudomaricurvus alcaniphilus]
MKSNNSISAQLVAVFSGCIDKLDALIDWRYLFPCLLILVSFLCLPIVWNGNEEQYFQLALRRVAPEGFGPYDAAFDTSKARLVFETILGLIIQLTGYEVAHQIARVINIIALALGLTVFFSALKFSVFKVIAVIVLFDLAGQEFFAGEWIFDTVESKTFAYAAVFAALGFGLRQRWVPAVVFAAIATYMHFLVGGFGCVVLILLANRYVGRWQLDLRLLLGYSALILPLLVLLFIEQYGGSASVRFSDIADIYAERVSHHVVPFASLYAFSKWLPGIIFTASVGLFMLLTRDWAQDKALHDSVLILLAYLFLALVVAFFDRHDHTFAKFYLFRPSSLILLLAIIAALAMFFYRSDGNSLPLLKVTLFVIILNYLGVELLEKIKIIRSEEVSANSLAIIDAVDQYVPPGEVVLIEPEYAHTESYSLHRRLARPTLVAWKFLPTYPEDVLEWHQRLEFQERVFSGQCSGPLKYPTAFLLTFSKAALERVMPCGEILWQSAEGSALLKLAPQTP